MMPSNERITVLVGSLSDMPFARRIQDFLKKGGLTGFLEYENLNIIEHYDVDWASSHIIISEFT